MSTSVKASSSDASDALSRHPKRPRKWPRLSCSPSPGLTAEPGPPTSSARRHLPIGCIGQPQCTIEITDEDFRSMIDGGTQAAMQIFLAAG